MDKSLLMFRGGIRSEKKTLADGKEHTIYFKAKTPDEIAVYVGGEGRYSPDEKGDLLRQKVRAEFIASSLCDESGAPLMTPDEARMIPATLKPEICAMIIKGSNTIGDEGKG